MLIYHLKTTEYSKMVTTNKKHLKSVYVISNGTNKRIVNLE